MPSALDFDCNQLSSATKHKIHLSIPVSPIVPFTDSRGDCVDDMCAYRGLDDSVPKGMVLARVGQ